MDFLKTLALTGFLGLAMVTTAPTAFAVGKIENATNAEVAEAIESTIKSAEDTLAAIENGVDEETVMAMMKTTKQFAKKIESTVTFSIRDKGMTRLKHARSAYKKGDIEAAKAFMVETIDVFKQTKTKFHNF